MSASPQQLALALRLRASATFANFVELENGATMHALRAFLQQPQGGLFYLFGATGSGRSHLLQAACNEEGNNFVIYLPIAEFKVDKPEVVLENLDQAPLLCLDDIDSVCHDPNWCEQLFHLCNRMLAADQKLLISALQPAAHIDCALADLRSRLAWGGNFPLRSLDDEGRRLLLQMGARDRGFELREDVAAYILTRHSRGVGELLGLLDVLDRESLMQKKRITIPFVRSVLESQANLSA